MWDDFSDRLSNVWEFLAESAKPVSVLEIHRGTGVSMVNVISSLRELEEVSLVFLTNSGAEASGNTHTEMWRLKDVLTPMDWARAVETGVSLSCLEKTASLSVKEKREASNALVSGIIDEERQNREEEKRLVRRQTIRGRAASRAAATDLAKVVEDAQKALASSTSPVSHVFREEAQRALETLITAMEKKK